MRRNLATDGAPHATPPRPVHRDRRASNYEAPRSDDREEGRRRHSIEVTVQPPPPASQPTKGGGFFSGLFQRKPRKMATGQVFSMFRKPPQPYFEEISPRSSLAYADRLPAEAQALPSNDRASYQAETSNDTSRSLQHDDLLQRHHVVLGSSRRQSVDQPQKDPVHEPATMETPVPVLPRPRVKSSHGTSSSHGSGQRDLSTSSPSVRGGPEPTIPPPAQESTRHGSSSPSAHSRKLQSVLERYGGLASNQSNTWQDSASTDNLAAATLPSLERLRGGDQVTVAPPRRSFVPPREAVLFGSFDVDSEADSDMTEEDSPRNNTGAGRVNDPRTLPEVSHGHRLDRPAPMPTDKPPQSAWMAAMEAADKDGFGDDEDDDDLDDTNQAVKSFRHDPDRRFQFDPSFEDDDEFDMDNTSYAVKQFRHRLVGDDGRREVDDSFASSIPIAESIEGSSFYSTTMYDPGHTPRDNGYGDSDDDGDFPSTGAVYNTRQTLPPRLVPDQSHPESPASYAPIVLDDSSDSDEESLTLDRLHQHDQWTLALDNHSRLKNGSTTEHPPPVALSAEALHMHDARTSQNGPVSGPTSRNGTKSSKSTAIDTAKTLSQLHFVAPSDAAPAASSYTTPSERAAASNNAVHEARSPGNNIPLPTLDNQRDSSDDDSSSDDFSDSVGSPANSLILDSVYETQQPGPSLRRAPSADLMLPPSTRMDIHRRRESVDRSSRRATWYPVPELVPTAAHETVSAAVQDILNRVTSHKRMSKESLEVKACMPEYRLEKADWMLARKRQSDNALLTLGVVARVPLDLLVMDATGTSSQNNLRTTHSGYLLKRGEVNVTMQRRYMILQDNELVYYKTNPELNKGWFGKDKPRGSLHLGNVSLVRPYLSTLTLELVTTKRTWVLQAESEREYKAWARAICRSVPYEVVDVVFRRMFQLAEVDASSVNEVRLATLPSYTVVETVEHIFVNYAQMAGALPLKPYKPSDYFLKVTGYQDYMVNPASTMDQYSHVQDCLFSKKTLCLTVQHRDCIVESVQDAMRTDNRRFSAAALPDAPAPPTQVVPSGKYTYPIQFALQEVQSLTPLGNTHVAVVAELVYAGQRLEKVADSAEVPLKASVSGKTSGRWSRTRWHKSALPVSALPKETRLVLTVYGFQTTQIEKWTPLATAGVNLFDADDVLVHGELALPLLESVPSCYSGPLSRIAQLEDGAPYIVITVATPNTPVKFDWTVHSGSVREPDRSLDRCGWLSERPPNGLTWTDKWCQLHHSTCSLVLAADNKAGGPHQSLPLDGAEVVVMDTLNRRHTTKLTQSTRREQQTWAFQLTLQGNPRVYILAARTRHERDAWMKTIQLVASHTDFDLMDVVADKSDPRASVIGQFAKPVGTAQAAAELGEFDYLVQLIEENPLYQLCGYEKAILWRHRRAFLGSFEALPRMLTCVNWLDPRQVAEMLALLPSWTTPRHPTSYIALLECVDSRVRQFAVDQLKKLTDTAFRQISPQLVQALKYEAHHTSPLSTMLIERAIKTPNPLGLDLYWALKVETFFPQHRERFGLLLNAYTDVCSVKTRSTFELQDKLFGQGGRLEAVCQEIKRVKASGASDKDVLAALHAQLDQLNAWLPMRSYQLPIDSRIEVGKLVVANCRVMSSAKFPLWLEFENAEAGQPSVAAIFKSGDDLRQDALVLQLIRVMDDMWRETGKDLGMEPYRCVATGPSAGLVQVVPHAATTAAIQRRGSAMRGIMGAFNLECFAHWIGQHNTTPKTLKAAKDLFLRSCAGYCVATHILGIGDRHNDNIMVTRAGRYFHIDFGHFLGFFKYVPLLGIVTIKRERTPFVFTPQMSHVFGGDGSPGFAKFIKTGADAFNGVRRHFHAIVSLLLLMLPAQLPELRHRDDLNYVVDAMAPELSPQDAASMFEDLVRQCHSCKWKQYDNAAHLAYHA